MAWQGKQRPVFPAVEDKPQRDQIEQLLELMMGSGPESPRGRSSGLMDLVPGVGASMAAMLRRVRSAKDWPGHQSFQRFLNEARSRYWGAKSTLEDNKRLFQKDPGEGPRQRSFGYEPLEYHLYSMEDILWPWMHKTNEPLPGAWTSYPNEPPRNILHNTERLANLTGTHAMRVGNDIHVNEWARSREGQKGVPISGAITGQKTGYVGREPETPLRKRRWINQQYATSDLTRGAYLQGIREAAEGQRGGLGRAERALASGIPIGTDHDYDRTLRYLPDIDYGGIELYDNLLEKVGKHIGDLNRPLRLDDVRAMRERFPNLPHPVLVHLLEEAQSRQMHMMFMGNPRRIDSITPPNREFSELLGNRMSPWNNRPDALLSWGRRRDNQATEYPRSVRPMLFTDQHSNPVRWGPGEHHRDAMKGVFDDWTSFQRLGPFEYIHDPALPPTRQGTPHYRIPWDSAFERR